MDEKLRALLMALRHTLTEIIAALEDYLDITYGESVLYRRRKKEMRNG